jgi:hypothetical protein
MIVYTEEEEQLLASMLIEVIHGEVDRLMQNQVFSLVDSLLRQKDDHSEEAPLDISKMKAMPLDEMPLLINSDDLLIRTVAQWRLKIGK